MAFEDWVDAISALWDGVSDGRGGRVRSYRLVEIEEFPESLSQFPCVITYPTELRSIYSAGGPCSDVWRGVAEFHLYPNVSKHNLPDLARYYARIRAAAAGSITLGGKVAHFALRIDVPSIQGPVELKYGGEEPHLGLLVNWEAKEDVSGDFAVSA